MTRQDQAVNLREQLAAIEHQRWADWQAYLHAKCDRRSDGSLVIPPELVQHWGRQIQTVYEDLTEQEKDSGRLQVDRTWHVMQGIRNNYEDELTRVRQSHQAAARLHIQTRKRLEHAENALAEMAQWLLEHTTADEQARQRLAAGEIDYITGRVLDLLDKTREGLTAVWSLLLDRLQPALLNLVAETVSGQDKTDPEGGGDAVSSDPHHS